MTESGRPARGDPLRYAQLTALAATLIAVAFTVQAVPDVPRLELGGVRAAFAYGLFVAAACFLALTWAVLWRSGHEPTGRLLAYLGSFTAAYLASIVVPSGELGLPHVVWIFGGPLHAHFILRFFETFVQLSPEHLRAVRGPGRATGLATALVEAWMSRAIVRWGVALAASTIPVVQLLGPAGTPSRLIGIEVDAEGAGLHLLAQSAVMIVLLAFFASFVVTAYRLGDDEHRRRMRWILWSVMGNLATWGLAIAGVWVALLVPLPDVARIFVGLVIGLCVPGGYVLAAIGFALAVFYDGALDAQPFIDATALYGALGAALLFGFGGLEVMLGDVVLATVGAPSGASTWIAGGAVAIAFGPLRSRFRRSLDHWLHDTLPATLLAQGPRRPATIVFTDIVGFSTLAAEDEDSALTLLTVFERFARQGAKAHDGSLVKTMGDGALMEFPDAEHALSAAGALHDSFDAALGPLGLPVFRLRTGIHHGLVARRVDGDLLGDAVNVAARVEGLAESGQIVVSQAVAVQLEGVELEDLGEQSLKNVPEPMRCWAVAGRP